MDSPVNGYVLKEMDIAAISKKIWDAYVAKVLKPNHEQDEATLAAEAKEAGEPYTIRAFETPRRPGFGYEFPNVSKDTPTDKLPEVLPAFRDAARTACDAINAKIEAKMGSKYRVDFKPGELFSDAKIRTEGINGIRNRVRSLVTGALMQYKGVLDAASDVEVM